MNRQTAANLIDAMANGPHSVASFAYWPELETADNREGV